MKKDNQWQRIFRLIPKSFHRKGMWVGVSLLLRALLNFAGVAALLPVLVLVLDDERKRNYMLPICLAVLIFILLKNVLNILLLRFQNRYLLSLYRSFSSRLFRTYYQRGWLFIKKSSPAELTYEVNYACYAFSFNVLASIFSMIAEAILLLLLYAGVFIYAPKEALLMPMVFIPAIWAYIRWGRSRLQIYGRQGNDAKRRQSRVVQELFNGYPEIEINQAFHNMRERFEKGLRDISYYQERSVTIQSIPMGIMEACVIIGVMVLILLGGENGDLKVTMGVFAVAAIRMLPAIRSLLGGWTAVKNNQFATDVVEAIPKDDVAEEEAEDTVPMTFNDKLEINHLSFSYEPNTPVIDDLTFAIYKGERLGIQGASGVGKSTLFNLLLGFFPPEKGSISIDGVPLDKSNRLAWQRIVGYVPQDVFIMNETLAENIAFGQPAAEIDRAKVMQVLEQVCLKDWVDKLPEGLDTKPGDMGSRMSGGQKQRIGIARALYKDAEMLFFDEATSSLDRATEQEIIEAIKQLSETHREITMIIIAHRKESLELCDRIIDII